MPASVPTSDEFNTALNGVNTSLISMQSQISSLNTQLNSLAARVTKLENPTPVSTLYDQLTTTYDFSTDGALSPNGLWRLGYHGINPVDSTDVGKCGVRVSAIDGKNVLYEYPYSKANTTPKWPDPAGRTSASLIVTEQSFADLDMTVYMRTLKSLRTPSPNRWEAAWIGWHFNDAGYTITQKGAHFHHYYFMIHTDSTLEFGRKDNTTMTEHQYTLPTLNINVPFAYGQLYKVRVKQVSNHIEIWVDDKKVVDCIDDGTKGTPGTDTTFGPPPHPPSTFMYSGRVWLYNEDAPSEWRDLTITKL